MSSYFACCPCQICNEESQFICFCSRVNLCFNCLPTHLLQEVSEKHRPTLIENTVLYLDETESQRKQVFSSIISKLQNEILHLEEFKKIAAQKLIDSISNIKLEIDKFCENSLKLLEELWLKANEELRTALSLSKVSLNVNHPVLDLFKKCRSIEDVKNVNVIEQHLEMDTLDITSLMQNHLKLSLVINKDKDSRAFPAKSPADKVGKSEKSMIVRHVSGISMSSLANSVNDSFSSNFTYSATSPDAQRDDLKYSKVWDKQVFNDIEKFSIEMELQERNLPLKESKSKTVSEYRPPTMYKVETFSEEIFAINLDNLQKYILFINQEKIFPKSACCLSEDDKLFIAGGFDGTPRKAVVVFNIKSRKTEKTQNMNQPRFNHSLVSCGKYVYAIGGMCSAPLKNCEKFCLVKKVWKKVGNMSVGRECCSVCVHFNLIYVFGGNGIESVEMYSPYKKKFTLLSIRLPAPGKCLAFPYDSDIILMQREKVLMVQTGKKVMNEVNQIGNGDWWSPSEPLVTAYFVYFFVGEELFKFNIKDYTVEKVLI